MKHQGFNIAILILSGITVVYIIYPLVTILSFAEPTKILDSLTRPQVWNALIISLVSATISTSVLMF